MPDADDVQVDERGQRERRAHLDVLRHEQQLPAIVAIGDDAADQREEQDRQLRRETNRGRGRTPTTVPVSVSTSQFCATFCIQVPMVEVNAPNQRTRKSR